MTSTNELDMFIQDFLRTNRFMNSRISWTDLVNRRFAETSVRKIIQFADCVSKADGDHLNALLTHVALPDTDWLRIELPYPRSFQGQEHRFECLQMTMNGTHTNISTDTSVPKTVLVKLTTRHLGMINVVFVIRENSSGIANPFLM